MDELNGGMKEKLLQAILEMFTQMSDKEEKPDMAGDPRAALLQVDAMGSPEDKKPEMC